MSIRSNLGAGVVPVLTTDTTLFTKGNDVDRYQVGACNVYNTTGATIVLSVYISPDLTSASGALVDTVSIGANSEIDVNSIVGQGYTAQNIIVLADAIGLNASLTRTEYSSGD